LLEDGAGPYWAGGFIAVSLVQASLNSTTPACRYSLERQAAFEAEAVCGVTVVGLIAHSFVQRSLNRTTPDR